MTKIIIAGCRKFPEDNTSIANLWDKLERVYASVSDGHDMIVSGGAKGADTFGESFARAHDIPVMTFLPEYALYPENPQYAPIARNIRMAEFSDVLVAFWDGKSKGTENIIIEMLNRNKRVEMIWI